MKIHAFQFKGQQLQLHPYKAIFWEEQSTLLLADLHLGKAQHFRKAGIPVPSDAGNSNWDKLIELLLGYQPKRVIFLGDLFHSVHNPVWEEFIDFIQPFAPTSFELIPGNHDILSDYQYQKSGLVIHEETLAMGPFLLSHEPSPTPEGQYNLVGHIHPCVYLKGNARQRLRLPCFYFGEKQGILPAFGSFTGMAPLQPKSVDQVFVVTEEAVLPV